VDINTDGSQEVSIEEFVTKAGLAIAQLGVQDLSQLIGNLLILGIHELRHQDLGEKPRKVIKFDCEFFEIIIGEATAFETIKI
jgi:hypothetical protein